MAPFTDAGQSADWKDHQHIVRSNSLRYLTDRIATVRVRPNERQAIKATVLRVGHSIRLNRGAVDLQLALREDLHRCLVWLLLNLIVVPQRLQLRYDVLQRLVVCRTTKVAISLRGCKCKILPRLGMA
jgi:hypothetical protein